MRYTVGVVLASYWSIDMTPSMATRRALILFCVLLVLPEINTRPLPVAKQNAIRKNQQDGLPIVFIPGKGGNQLEAKVDRTQSTGKAHCPKTVDWYRIWMDLWTFFRDGVDCWAENMELRFNETAGKSSNAIGVETRVPGWGTTEGIEYVDPSWTAWVLGNIGVYASYLVEALAQRGYQRGISIRGAPYDFRYAPTSQADYFRRLQQLIEETAAWNGDRKVLLVTHSMGGRMAGYFLSQQSAEWKDRYVAGLVTINTPWSGAVVLVEMHAAGINWEIDAIDRLTVRGQQRSYESGLMLLPHRDAWKSDDVIVQTPSRNFTVNDYDDFFDKIGYPLGRRILATLSSGGVHFSSLAPPGVPVYCTYSVNVPTPEMLVYDTDEAFPDSRPRPVMGDGDGTINKRSLEMCKQWIGINNGHPVIVKEYDGGVNHQDLLSDTRLANDIIDVTLKQ